MLYIGGQARLSGMVPVRVHVCHVMLAGDHRAAVGKSHFPQHHVFLGCADGVVTQQNSTGLTVWIQDESRESQADFLRNFAITLRLDTGFPLA